VCAPLRHLARADGNLGAVSNSDRDPAAPRIRREPPRFRQVTVSRVEAISPRLQRITLTGGELEGFAVDLPAASVRVLLPPPGSAQLVMPAWNGNEFLLPDGARPAIRTFTPRRVDPDALELDIDVVLHGSGAASEWAGTASAGAPAAVSGPGRGYAIDAAAPAFVLAGDESAIPALSQLLEVLPAATPVQVFVEIAAAEARIDLGPHARAVIEWRELADGAPAGDGMFAALRDAEIVPDARVWVAGEAAGVQRIRKHLFEVRGLTRTQATVRGYWKHGRAGTDDE
jgi:NADPH-dependent ferric siderophore reductase